MASNAQFAMLADTELGISLVEPLTLLLFAVGPRGDWARTCLESQAESPLAIKIVAPSQIDAALTVAPPYVLVLVDPIPFANVDAPVASYDSILADALRAVCAVELSQRADRTVVLTGDDAATWAATLGDILDVILDPTVAGPLTPMRRGETDTPLCTSYLHPLWAAARSGRRPIVSWQREAFLHGDDPGKQLPALVEVAGRERILAYGPYLPLPSGSWTATAYLGFSTDIGEMSFMLEAVVGGPNVHGRYNIARGFFEVKSGGLFTLDLDFEVPDPLYKIELRLISQDSALWGQAALIEVRFTPALKGASDD